MKIEHIAIWVKDLEKMKTFYEEFFSADAGEKYHNPKKNFTSYFLHFESGCSIELMHRPDIADIDKTSEYFGFTHLAISCGNKESVDKLTETFRQKGYSVISEPRTTGDGFYESVILDPENNRIELTE